MNRNTTTPEPSAVLGSYSDWHNTAPVPCCPQCRGTHLHSRDCPAGLEVACDSALCGWREVFPPGHFGAWPAAQRPAGVPKS